MANGKTPVPEMSLAYFDFYKTNGMAHKAVMPGGPSLTRQEFADDCDINILMQKFQNHDIGAIMRRSQEPMYVDFSSIPSDLMGTMQLLDEASEAFMTLPAQVRREFDNDPYRFVAFASDPANIEQMRTWNLAKPAPAPAPPSPSSPAPTGGVKGDAPPSPAPSLPPSSATP